MTSDPTAPPGCVPAAELDELFTGPLDDFVPARDALARRLRADGERDAAAWVKGLRKPTLAAWAVNRATREHDDLRQELLAATAALTDAQARLLSGTGDARELRAAAERRRAGEAALLRALRGVRDGAGRALGDAVVERARTTLAAVVLDERARAELAAGRLTRERRAAGLGDLDAAAPAALHGREAGGEAASGRAASSRGRTARGGKAAKRRADEPTGEGAAGGGPRTGRRAEPRAPREAGRGEGRAPSPRGLRDGGQRLRELRATLAAAERAQGDAEARRGAAEAGAREAAERLAAARAAQAAADEALAQARTEERSAARAVADARRRLRRIER